MEGNRVKHSSIRKPLHSEMIPARWAFLVLQIRLGVSQPDRYAR